MGKAEKPWTWEEISKLRVRERRAFEQEYGERGRAALVAAENLFGKGRFVCGSWPCSMCQMRGEVMKNPRMRCYDAAMPVYARLIAERGRMPQEERR